MPFERWLHVITTAHPVLFETTPTDLATFAAVAAMMFFAALAAGAIPARRAPRIDPLVALRHE